MFQSYKYIKYIDRKDGEVSFEYELTDSDFGTVSGVGVGVGVGVEVEDGVVVGISGTDVRVLGVVVAVIQEYSKLKLNVAKNLVLAFVWHDKLYPKWSIQGMIDYNKKNNPLFSQYEEDLQKYLLLL